MNASNQTETETALVPAGKKPIIRRGRKANVCASLTPEDVQPVCDLIALGVPENFACAHAGIAISTFRRARARKEISQVLEKARAEFIARALKAIVKGGEMEEVDTGKGVKFARRPWYGLAWILERRYPEFFRRSPEVALFGQQQNVVVGLSSKDVDAIRRAAEKAYGTGSPDEEARQIEGE